MFQSPDNLKPKRSCHRTFVGLLAKKKNPSQLTIGQSLHNSASRRKLPLEDMGTVLLRFRHTIWLVSKNDIQLRREATKEEEKVGKGRLEKKAKKGEASFFALKHGTDRNPPPLLCVSARSNGSVW